MYSQQAQPSFSTWSCSLDSLWHIGNGMKSPLAPKNWPTCNHSLRYLIHSMAMLSVYTCGLCLDGKTVAVDVVIAKMWHENGHARSHVHCRPSSRSLSCLQPKSTSLLQPIHDAESSALPSVWCCPILGILEPLLCLERICKLSISHWHASKIVQCGMQLERGRAQSHDGCQDRGS